MLEFDGDYFIYLQLICKKGGLLLKFH